MRHYNSGLPVVRVGARVRVIYTRLVVCLVSCGLCTCQIRQADGSSFIPPLLCTVPECLVFVLHLLCMGRLQRVRRGCFRGCSFLGTLFHPLGERAAMEISPHCRHPALVATTACTFEPSSFLFEDSAPASCERLVTPNQTCLPVMELLRHGLAPPISHPQAHIASGTMTGRTTEATSRPRPCLEAPPTLTNILRH